MYLSELERMLPKLERKMSEINIDLNLVIFICNAPLNIKLLQIFRKTKKYPSDGVCYGWLSIQAIQAEAGNY